MSFGGFNCCLPQVSKIERSGRNEFPVYPYCEANLQLVLISSSSAQIDKCSSILSLLSRSSLHCRNSYIQSSSRES